MDDRVTAGNAATAEVDRIARSIAMECASFRATQLRASDGATLRVYDCGEPAAPPLLVINPVGVSVLLVARLARELARHYRVITWEQRGLNWDIATFDARRHDYSAFLQDVDDVYRARVGAACPVIAICSGASLAIKAAARGTLAATSLLLVSPSLRFEGHVPSLYDQSAVPYMREVAREGRPLAELLIKMSRAPINEQASSWDERVIRAADRAYLGSVESVLIQARTVTEFASQTVDAELPQLTQAVALVCAGNDEIVSIESARRLVARMPRGRLLEHQAGGHYSLYLDPEVRQVVWKELENQRIS